MILFLGKIYDNEEYAASFLEGKLFARRLRCFKKMEEEDDERGDKYEGAIMPSLPGLSFEFEATNTETGKTMEIAGTGEDRDSPPILEPEWFDHVNVFCLYAGHSGDFQHISAENLASFRRQLELTEDCLELGEHAVVITNTTEFFRRVARAVQERKCPSYRRLVRYYDPHIGTPPIESVLDTIFLKRKRYEHQKEYRIATDSGSMGCDSITLDIGPISDVAFRMKASEINASLRIGIGEAHRDTGESAQQG